ncbi:hypothetical protein FSP39_014305 [Pinctada imbricata]|uniref:Uncharacterized protein n=1 Tax=Pinctada imbricata TaxID=66713 RepID=A0AA88YD52_PINIB|nr:hypothetical protein FSP39_014305 [Pinctada imbricata]
MSSGRPVQTNPNIGPDHYEAASKWNKEILITTDPVFVNKAVINGRYIGRKPHNYLPLAILVCIINPIMGPLGILFSVMSNRSYADGDIKYSQKWASYSFMSSMITIGVTIFLAIIVGFSLSPLGIRGGHTP